MVKLYWPVLHDLATGGPRVEMTESPHGTWVRFQDHESDLEGVRLINKLQAEALAEERDMNRQLTAALAAARATSDAGVKCCVHPNSDCNCACHKARGAGS